MEVMGKIMEYKALGMVDVNCYPMSKRKGRGASSDIDV